MVDIETAALWAASRGLRDSSLGVAETAKAINTLVQLAATAESPTVRKRAYACLRQRGIVLSPPDADMSDEGEYVVEQ